jgi:hypothetical protein
VRTLRDNLKHPVSQTEWVVLCPLVQCWAWTRAHPASAAPADREPEISDVPFFLPDMRTIADWFDKHLKKTEAANAAR